MKTFVFSLVATAPLFADELSQMPPDRSFWHTFTMLALAGILFYFVMFLPEQKRRKLMEKQRAEMKPGDEVTAVGIIGTIAKIDGDKVILKMYDGHKIKVWKAAITEVTPAPVDE